MNRRFFVFGLLVFVLTEINLPACLWDRDTLKEELKRLDKYGDEGQLIFDTLVGRIPQYPPLYYTMRYERVYAEIQNYPENLSLYDDAAVAADRLGDARAAFRMMAHKKKQLRGLAPSTDPEYIQNHWYRYYANMGTFFMHRWLRAGRKLEQMEDVERARKNIVRALEYNQEAHFGREKYQLAFIEWVLTFPDQIKSGKITGADPYDFLRRYEAQAVNILETDDLSEATRGVVGLMRLGDAWQSYDCIYALMKTLETRELFVLEAVAAVRLQADPALLQRSFLIQLAGEGQLDTVSDILRKDTTYYRGTNISKIEYQAGKAIEFANAWRGARTQFMTAKLREGKHPDTHKDFWEGFAKIESQLPSMKLSEISL